MEFKMQVLLSVAVLGLFSTAVSGLMSDDDVSCYMNVMTECDDELEPQPRDTIGYPNVEELDEMCKAPLFAMAQCVRDLSQKKCSEALASVMDDIAVVMEDICSAETELGRGYRNTVDCLNSVHNDYNECRSRKRSEFEDKLELLEFQDNVDGDERDRLNFCIGQQIEKQCSRHHIRETCGEEAEDVIERLEADMNQILMPESCTDEELKRAENLLQ